MLEKLVSHPNRRTVVVSIVEPAVIDDQLEIIAEIGVS